MRTITCHFSAATVWRGYPALLGFSRGRVWLTRLVSGCAVLLLIACLMPATMAKSEEDELIFTSKPTGNPTVQLHSVWGVGPWIWGPETHEKQTCRFWKAFDIPEGSTVTAAPLRIAVDNGYRLMLDGRQVGKGSDWRSITEYDISQLLTPGRHVLAVEAFNDSREAGFLFGLEIALKDGRRFNIASDTNWRVVPTNEPGWETRNHAALNWSKAVKVASFLPREGFWHDRRPTMLFKVAVPPPLEQRFWQSAWFQACLWTIVTFALLLSLWLMARLAMQSKAQELLHRERSRIARDIHDELGARLTELALEGEVIQTELPAGSSVSSKLEALCEKARAVSGAMDEVVWVLNSRRDTLHDFANYACKQAQRFLAPSPIRCRLDVDADLPQVPFELPVRRSLLLGVKEALNNAAKYSGATELFLRIHRRGKMLRVVVEDNGVGFDLALVDQERNGLTNMRERMKELGGTCRITTRPNAGCQVEFQVLLPRQARLISSSGAQDELPIAGLRMISTVSATGGKEIPTR